MIINNDKLIEQIITENSNLFEYDELDLNDQHILDELTKIKRIGIRFKPQDSLNIIEDTIKQLYALIEKCPNLELVSIFSTNSYAKKININNLIDLIVDHNIKRAVISGFDYDYLPLFNKILSTDNETVVSLDKIIDSENSLKYILGEEKLRKKLLFTSHGNDELNDLYLELRLGTISLKKYEKYKNYLTNYKDLYITIGNISELDISKLENIKTDSHIKGIYIKCGYEKEPQKYSFEEYENIRKVIDEIVQMVKLPKEDDTNREKLIFAQIYKILGKNIRYDYYVIAFKKQ